jgi:hypothetical protein
VDLEREMERTLERMEQINAETLAEDLQMHIALESGDRAAFEAAHERKRDLLREHALAVISVAALEFEGARARFEDAAAGYLELLARHHGEFERFPEGTPWTEIPEAARERIVALKEQMHLAYHKRGRLREKMGDAWSKCAALRRERGLETPAMNVYRSEGMAWTR